MTAAIAADFPAFGKLSPYIANKELQVILEISRQFWPWESSQRTA